MQNINNQCITNNIKNINNITLSNYDITPIYNDKINKNYINPLKDKIIDKDYRPSLSNIKKKKQYIIKENI